MPCFSRSRPAGTVLQNKLLASFRDAVLGRQPCHIEDQQPAFGLQQLLQLWREPFMVKVPEALAGGDDVKGVPRKVKLFRGDRTEIDLHVPLVRQPFRLLDLFGGDVRARPACSVLVQVPRQDARSRSDVKDALSLHAESSVHDPAVKFFGVDISVSGVFP